MAPVTVVGHSLGGSISLLYTALHPENVNKLIAIEGMGPPPSMIAERVNQPAEQRLHNWFSDLRKSSGRIVKRYPTLEDAFQRMQTENPHLSEEQARHLTIHGGNQNEDGTFSWKFDNYVRNFRLLVSHMKTSLKSTATLPAPLCWCAGWNPGHRTRWPMDAPKHSIVLLKWSPLPTLDTGCTTIN